MKECFEEPLKFAFIDFFLITCMRWTLNGSVAVNGREREGWEGVERLQQGLKGLSYTDEWVTNESRPLITSLKTLGEKKHM